MSCQVISSAYLMGIRDAREYTKRFNPDELEIRQILLNVQETAKRFSAGPVKDMLKGERDFWRNQLKGFKS